ncbi:MAG: TonB family protein, partial [Candidatus Cryptobacteroides sp.]|nr:TonB family protein [Candidatus Cryptobacteroides sp.]
SDHRAFYASEIPSVLFSTGYYPEHNTERDVPSILDYDGMEQELEYIYAFSRTLANVDKAPAFRPGKIEKKDDNVYPYYDCDQPPTFLGHSDPRFFIQKWVYSYLKYPEEAVREGIEGRVTVEFTIDKKGKVTDVEVTNGVHLLLDEEAEKVVKASPDWKPAKIKGKVVKSRISIPVEFRLEKKSKVSIGIKK